MGILRKIEEIRPLVYLDKLCLHYYGLIFINNNSKILTINPDSLNINMEQSLLNMDIWVKINIMSNKNISQIVNRIDGLDLKLIEECILK